MTREEKYYALLTTLFVCINDVITESKNVRETLRTTVHNNAGSYSKHALDTRALLRAKNRIAKANHLLFSAQNNLRIARGHNAYWIER